MKVAIIGNCQVNPIKACVDASPLDIQTSAYEVWRMSASDMQQLGNTLQDFDAVLSQPLLSSEFGGVTKPELQESCKTLGIPLLFIHNLYFDAIVPDCVYVGRAGNRIRGPISDYHSSIVLKSFLNGDSEATCFEKLSTGDMINVPNRWRASVAELAKREQQVDVSFMEELPSLIKAFNCMHYTNHPKPGLISAYTEKAFSMLLGEQISLKLTSDHLAVFGSWPVHHWVSEKLGFGYQANYFLKERSEGKMELDEYISCSFEIYSNTPTDNLV